MGRAGRTTLSSLSGHLLPHHSPPSRIGTYPVTFIVTSGNTPPQTASETIDLTVVDASPPPTVSTPVVSTRKRLSILAAFLGGGGPGDGLRSRQLRPDRARQKSQGPQEGGGSASG